MGEVGEYFVTCCHSRFAWGRGMHSPESRAGPIPQSAMVPMGQKQHRSSMRALEAHPGTPRAGNAPALPFGRCNFQTDGQCWVMEGCRARLASLRQHRTGARSSQDPPAHSGFYPTSLYVGEMGSLGFFCDWRPEEVCLAEGGGAGTEHGFVRSILTLSLTFLGWREEVTAQSTWDGPP